MSATRERLEALGFKEMTVEEWLDLRPEHVRSPIDDDVVTWLLDAVEGRPEKSTMGAAVIWGLIYDRMRELEEAE